MGRMFDTPVLPRLPELLQEVHDGTIQVPEFQRGYVWRDDDRLRLLDSVWQGLPIGSLLVWRTQVQNIRVKLQMGPCTLPRASGAGMRNYLFDGLQRVTTLYAALLGPVAPTVDADGWRWPIYFDLAPEPGDDQRFHLKHGSRDVPPTWMPLPYLLDDDRFFDFRRRLMEANLGHLVQEARRLESRFRDYVVPVVPLVSDDQNVVTAAFTRVNSSGQELDEGDMAHARTLEDGFSFNNELALVMERIVALGWGRLDRKTLIAALKAIWGLDVYKSGGKGLTDKLESDEGRALLHALPDLFAPVAKLLRGFGVHGPGSLPYAYQLVALLRVAHVVGAERLDDAARDLRRWFFWTTYDEHFTGMTSGQLRTEFERVEALARGQRTLDWIPAPRVAPLTNLRPSAVRSRAAVLVMAIAGDLAAGWEEQCALYGAQGTDGLRRLFTEKSADALANRVLVRDQDLKRLRMWATTLNLQLTIFESAQDQLLRANLMNGLEADAYLSPDHLLQARAARLQEEERKFLNELGGKLDPSA